MNKDFREIAEYWKKEYSDQIKEAKKYEASEQFKQLSAFLTPGNSYYYIVNFHNLELDLVSDSVEDFTGVDRENVTMNDILGTALPEEIEFVKKKENVINDFFMRYLDREEILSYKVIYTYRMKDAKGKIRTILHQATPLSMTDNGMFQHVFSVHSDISYLKMVSSRDVSFVHLKGGRSYYNINTVHGCFDPRYSEFREQSLNDLLTEREKEIVSELARGLSAEDIARELNLSPHTVKTHRKNILQKSGSSNTAQLVAKCITGGVISHHLN
ncbi:response regulator transcription factor [Gramella sp. KN1008]|uniref:response regulator transcription factor n=1 Tax=Gramella sp. KN1008 TaxID=2529298 RepID=UPI00103B1B5A|nr:helix-turn-helix transcriptional regulator [Gramella sp. KN1008]TBW27129.1 LuxR family transcriptional regulator [Gramella sp. KN1008]